MPKIFQSYRQTWIKYHPHWELILWNEKNIDQLKYFQRENFEKLSNYSEKSDYLRFCISFDFKFSNVSVVAHLV